MKKKLRIAFTGPESSGKTTLSELAASHFNWNFIPEYAREFVADKTEYTFEDLDLMANEQVKRWEEYEESNYIADTEMTVFMIWSKVKYGTVSEQITSLWKEQRFDILFLCKPDIPWVYDPLREHPNFREELFQLYVDFFDSRSQQFVIVKGNYKERWEIVINEIEKLIENKK